jgi:hypothetical protein
MCLLIEEVRLQDLAYPRPDAPGITPSRHPAEPRPGRACNSDGWICGIVDAL